MVMYDNLKRKFTVAVVDKSMSVTVFHIIFIDNSSYFIYIDQCFSTFFPNSFGFQTPKFSIPPLMLIKKVLNI